MTTFERATGYAGYGNGQNQCLTVPHVASPGEQYPGPQAIADAFKMLRGGSGAYDRHADDAYRIFAFNELRSDLYAAGWCLSDYAKREGVSAVYFLDRAARLAYVAMMGFWRARYPDAPMPHIGFLSPKGFVSREDVRDGTVVLPDSKDISNSARSARRLDVVEPESYIRPQQAIMDEIKENMRTNERGPIVHLRCMYARRECYPSHAR